MAKILVTGGAGFLGSFLCERLLEAGNEVIALDDLSTGCAKRIAHLEDTSSFTFVRRDILQPFDTENFDVDQIYNLACPASPPRYQSDPIRTTKINVIGVLNVLDLALRTGARVFQASTSEVYGDPEVHPQPETYFGNVNPTGIRACYDEGKRCAETLIYDHHRQHGTTVKVARIFNTYGPRMSRDDGRVVSNFICQALLNEDITIYGEGQQTRSFCYVDDLIDGFIRLMGSGEEVHEPVNLGNAGEFTMLELADRILKLTGSSSNIIHLPLPGDDPKLRRPDTSRAKSLLDWEPRISLETGLRRTIEFFRDELSDRKAA